MIHGFDIDGVVTCPTSLVKSIAKEYEGFNYKDLVDYDIGVSLVKSGFISNRKEFDAGYFFKKYNEDILAGADISEGFIDYFSSLKGNEIHFITARQQGDEDLTERLFHKNGIPFYNVHHVGSTNKVGLVEWLGVNKFYEDNLDTALRVAKLGTVDVVLVDTVYNQMLDLPYKTIRRIKTWGELV